LKLETGNSKLDLSFLDPFREKWQPISAAALIAWLVFYFLFLLYALVDRSGFLFIDNANLIVHEAGHLLFSYFGETLMILGGTIFELFVPFALAVYFAWRRQPAGTAFCSFFFFENFLYIATYMADARAQELPLVTVGDSDYVEHDWFHIFSSVGLLQHDTQIGAFVRILGWLGMLATVAWLAWRWKQSSETKPVSQ
jgi:hypothetical protein